MTKKILIVDDEPMIRDVCSEFMKVAGYETDCAEDGVKGLEKISSGKPDLVILDLMMPNLNGAEVLKRLSANNVKIPVVVITAYQNSAQEATIRQDPNVVSFMRKPIDYSELTALIVKQVGVSQATSAHPD